MRPRTVPLVLLVLLVVGAGGAGYYAYRKAYGVKVRTVSGTILRIDAAARKATIETTVRKTGGTVELTGEIPADCPIELNGRPATLSDVRAGDQATVRGGLFIEKDEKHVRAHWIKVTRAETLTGAPATSAPAP